MKLFEAQHITRSHLMHISAPPERVFPLFEPIGEKQWAQGWEPEMIYPPSGAAEEGTVFTTRSHSEADTIWNLVTFDAVRKQILYLSVTPDSHVATLNIRCQETPHTSTQAMVTYTFTALTERGNAYISKYTEQYYKVWMSAWETAINHYLLHGRPLQHH